MEKDPFIGFKVYVVYHKKEQRRMACLYNPSTGEHKTLAYAKYLMCIKEGRILRRDEEVDHINEDRQDDRIENLQILTKLKNVQKSNPKRVPTYICPICNKEFVPTRKQFNRPNPCCSRKYGYEKSHLTATKSH